MRNLIFLLFISAVIFSCKKVETLDSTNKSAPITAPTASTNGLDSLKIGDSTILNFALTGTAPFKLVYSDGTNNQTVENINTNPFSIYVKPLKTTIYKAVSISDKNTTGSVSGEFNVWVQPQFSSKSPSYKNINLTSGNIQNNIFYRGNYYHLDDINILFSFKANDKNGAPSTFQMSDHTYAFFDFNQDGYLDLFGWCYNLTPVMGRNPGKYILIDNISSSKRKISYFDSDISWPSGMETNDFNKDGVNDIIFYSYNTHVDLGGQSNNTAKPVKVLLFKKDGTYKEQDATIPLVVHDIASGDLNNDGFNDILVWEYSGSNKPRFYINNGSGTFIEKPSTAINGLQEILNSRSQGFTTLAVELFDLNNDGILDIITGNEVGGNSWDYITHNNTVGYKLKTQRVYWGESNGVFDFKNGFTDLPNNSIPIWSNTQSGYNDSIKIFNNNAIFVLGFNFVDYNNDGRFDIVSALTRNYNGYIIQIHENLGNNQFKDVTIDIVGNYNGTNDNFPNFYEIRPFDIDNDGDYDLIPHGVVCWNPFIYSKNLFWENTSQKYVMKK